MRQKWRGHSWGQSGGSGGTVVEWAKRSVKSRALEEREIIYIYILYILRVDK